MLPSGHTNLPVGMPSQKTSFVAGRNAYAFNSTEIDHRGNSYRGGGGSWGTERESGKEENGNQWNHFQKHKEMNLFMQAIETE